MILPRDLPAAEVINPSGAAGLILICEHASAFIPPSLSGLGISEEARLSHAAWDIGALDVATEMSSRLGAPLVAATTSRLVYDCNRPPNSPSAMPARSERFDIPGNQTLSAQARAARVEAIYTPFCKTVSDVIGAQSTPPVIVTIHSFTPVFHGTTRPTEIGILHDADPSLAHKIFACSGKHTALQVDLNKPYDREDGVTHTLALHGTANHLPNVMIEVRNDLIDTPVAARDMGKTLAAILQDALATPMDEAS